MKLSKNGKCGPSNFDGDSAGAACDDDDDSDGMPDAFGLQYSLNPKDPSDADGDADGESNLQEYLAGTNPQSNERATALGAIQLLLLDE